MSAAPLPRTYERAVEILEACAPAIPPTRPPRTRPYTRDECLAAINTPEVDYQPAIRVLYRGFQLSNGLNLTWSPLRLFLRLISPILDLLVLHTNVVAQRLENTWKPITDLEIRRWLACRLEMMSVVPLGTTMNSFWHSHAQAARYLGQRRFAAIEHYICLESSEEAPSNSAPWFWKVATALNIFRDLLKSTFIPSSHLCVDESTVKFHGRKSDKFLLAHKPAKEGFILYSLASHGGLIHDFLVASSQHGIELNDNGITLDIATRTTRARKRGTTGTTATEIHLPPTKSAVFLLCERVTARFRDQPFICFTDNLFTDPHLARALLSINVGICGTVRGNATGIPPILKQIAATEPCLLDDDQLIHRTVDNLVNVIVWRDPLRRHTVTFATTAFSPTQTEVAPRRTRFIPTSEHRSGFHRIVAEQPKIAVQYNLHMGHVDVANQLRQQKTIRRAGQLKWTKKFIEFIVDVAHTNAFLAFQQYQQEPDPGHRERERFLTQLIAGLLHDQENTHTPSDRGKLTYCGWKQCTPGPSHGRQALGEVTGNARRVRTSKTAGYCTKCSKALCVKKGCWEAYHRYHSLPVGTPESVRGVEGGWRA